MQSFDYQKTFLSESFKNLTKETSFDAVVVNGAGR
jgi:hypothetical protein